jgi:ferric-dicitrate binding protein FerR (iron transport regulator)
MLRLLKNRTTMFQKNKTDWDLIAKYMAQEANENEIQSVTDWKNSNPGNRALFNEIKSDWMMMDAMNERFNVDDAWNKLQNRITDYREPVLIKKTDNTHKPSIRFHTPARIAATLLFLTVIGASLVYMTGRIQKVSVTTASNETGKKIVLPDGSTVYLNAATSFSLTVRHFLK